ncbi:MAG: arylsulfatase [Acidobacteria bacterium]|nr:arylsulfatase [Acidobacteriota bacterium]
MLTRRHFLHSAAMAGASAAAAPPRHPNIVVILSDDLGWGSLNCYGADPRLVRTPNIDRLATEGVRFTDANTPSSVCSPSRYALMTGRYCWRTSATSGVLGITSPLHIEPDRLNMASLLKSAGYSTAAIGKWHLGYGTGKTDYTKPIQPGPLDIGFDYHYGVPQNHGDATGIYVRNRETVGLRSTTVQPSGKTPYGRPFLGFDAPHRVDENVMDELTTDAIQWLERQNAHTPFFLYFTPVAIHYPYTPSKNVRGSSQAGLYGEWIHELDLSVGRILAALDRLGFTDNTLVVFSSDNGGVLLTEGDGPEAQAVRAGLRMNGPWRGRKHSIYQGGFRVPFLARWPGKVKPGTTCAETINLADMLATTSAILGRPLPPATAAAGDSVNVLPALLGRKLRKPLRDSMISHSVEGVFAIRQGPWKYIEGKPAAGVANIPDLRKGEMTPQLYNLRDDPGETNDLLRDNREVAARLADLLTTHRTQGHSVTR